MTIILKSINSMFVGAVENPIQYVNRTKFDWKLAVDNFDLNIQLYSKTPHKYSNLEFLKLIRQAKFGLSLEGFGPKCQRDIEYIANGVVPIFTWNSFNDYHNPLVENVHYLTAKHPREAKEKIQQTSKEHWKEMSSNCVEWFNKNCSIKGSFNFSFFLIASSLFLLKKLTAKAAAPAATANGPNGVPANKKPKRPN